MNNAQGELDPAEIAIGAHIAKCRIPPEAYASYVIVIVQSALRMAEKNGNEIDTDFVTALLDDFDNRLHDHGIAVEGGPQNE